MAELKKITQFLDDYLDIKNIKDGSWNGLQVAQNEHVNKILFAVDAGMQTFEKAVEVGAQMVVVHHGMFWNGVDPRCVGYTKKRMDFLYKHGISLYASHLPLDKHPEVGNNVQLLKLLGFEKDQEFGLYNGMMISFTGKTRKPKSLDEIKAILEKELGAQCKVLPFGKKEISTIAVCSGGGTNYSIIGEAIALGVDLYLTGDSTEMYHLARDVGFNAMFAGHNATETVGVKALADVAAQMCDVQTQFVDIPTGL